MGLEDGKGERIEREDGDVKEERREREEGKGGWKGRT